MSRERYFEACEATGSEPVQEEIPIGLDELTYESQTAFILFNACPESWEGMSGSYLGKRIECLPALFQIYDIEPHEQRMVFEIFRLIDTEFGKFVISSQKQKKHKEPTIDG